MIPTGRMNRFLVGVALVVAISLALVPAASAHTPIAADGNGTLAGATAIPDSRKSWAIYADLPRAGSAQYYRFEATKGERVPIELFTSPAEQDAGFVPSLVLMGPGLESRGTSPSNVQSPPDAGRVVVSGSAPARGTYEAFAPSVFFSVATTSFAAPRDGTYYVSVFDGPDGGRYGIAIGAAERFTPYEWLTTPLALSRVYAWEGQDPLLVYLPAFLVLVVGVGVLIGARRRERALDLPAWLAAIAGLLFIGSSVTVLTQMAFSLARSRPDAGVLVTLALGMLPLAAGVLALRVAMRHSGRWTPRRRTLLAALGIAALVVWAGWIIGPASAVIAAFVPSDPVARAAKADR